MKIPFLNVPNDEPLKDLPYERYLRIIGIFNTIPRTSFTAAQQELVTSFEVLRDLIGKMVDEESRKFTRDDAADYVHNLHLLLVQIMPLPLLTFMMHALREDFREIMGAESFQQYLSTDAACKLKALPPSDPAYEAAARADATYVVNETRRQQLSQRHVEQTRHFLIESISDGWRKVCIPLALLVLLFLLAHSAGERYRPQIETAGLAPTPGDLHLALLAQTDDVPPPPPLAPPSAAAAPAAAASPSPTPASLFGWFGGSMVRPGGKETALFKTLCALAVLASAGICGASGAYLSVLMRIQGFGDDTHIGRNVWVLHSSSTAARLGPVTGMTFAFVLSAILAGHLVSGELFPDLPKDKPWFFVLWHPNELAKWLVWAFIAGFSERLVPDMIDRLTARTRGERGSEPSIGAQLPPPPPSPPPPLPVPGDVVAPGPDPGAAARAPMHDDVAGGERGPHDPGGAAAADETRPGTG